MNTEVGRASSIVWHGFNEKLIGIDENAKDIFSLCLVINVQSRNENEIGSFTVME